MKRLNDLTDLAALLRSIDNSPESECGFAMDTPSPNSYTKHQCGTACCIGGWVIHTNFKDPFGVSLEEAVRSLQPDLDLIEFEWLCYPALGDGAYVATPEQAARAVEILRDTGKCDWERAMKESVKTPNGNSPITEESEIAMTYRLPTNTETNQKHAFLSGFVAAKDLPAHEPYDGNVHWEYYSQSVDGDGPVVDLVHVAFGQLSEAASNSTWIPHDHYCVGDWISDCCNFLRTGDGIAGPQWQPAATAPTDGTPFDAWCVSPYGAECRIADVRMRWDGSGFGIVVHTNTGVEWSYIDGRNKPAVLTSWSPIYWMPRPAPPKTVRDESEQ